MSTTTIRLDATLKARVDAAARRAGKTPHGFILDAIAQSVERADHEAELHRVADERWATLVTSGTSVAWDDAAAYLRARGRGERPRKPVARKLARRAR